MQRVVSPRPDNGATVTLPQWPSLASVEGLLAAPTRRIDKSLFQISMIVNTFHDPQYSRF
jgi:hypothetical protein